ncbi:uncharacterized protein AMSG_07930 [Thecamonas trahens ATCC 50062]|uniref:PH domain-containing protein n=1 Tax=Thecamonas trahens ATCC 50062 TaxID=461836 RepID=A0A0L0DHQ2_THETB|nr:hypothetical protein AMSG_07930 [Thecamonas trahens ATCC 50062]KNC51842.1 hypothetical protein AMSG_07930 [Thecamonas trahens ATCC 50062]|eukprot:XP_013755707.1 hypothetical protein AMSG_07930 [Thecamonas trahens ATCC 50062]
MALDDHGSSSPLLDRSESTASALAWARPPQWDSTSALAPLKGGYLVKQGERYKSWKRRWFELYPSLLAYFKTEPETSPKGVIPLRGRYIVAISPEDSGRDRCFALSHPSERTYYIQASSADELASWMLAINAAIEALGPTQPHGPASPRLNVADKSYVPGSIRLHGGSELPT